MWAGKMNQILCSDWLPESDKDGAVLPAQDWWLCSIEKNVLWRLFTKVFHSLFEAKESENKTKENLEENESKEN